MEESKQTNKSNPQSQDQSTSVFGGFKIAEDQGSGQATPIENKQETPEVSEQQGPVDIPTPQESAPVEVKPAENNTSSESMDLFDGFPIADENNETSESVTTPSPVTAPEVKQDSNIQSPTNVVAESESQDSVQENQETKVEEMPTPPVNGAEMTSPVEPSNGQDNNNDQNNKVKPVKKGVDFFLIGLFILLAIVIFNLPTISSYLKGDKKKASPTPTPTATPTATPEPTAVAYTKLTCNATESTENVTDENDLPAIYTYTAGGVTKSLSRVFYSSNGKLKQVENIITIDYQTVDTTNQAQFDQQKQRCATLSKTPISADGYKYTCKQTDNKFVETETFDLTQNDQAVTVTKDGVTTMMSSGYSLDDDMNKVKEVVVLLGNKVVCK